MSASNWDIELNSHELRWNIIILIVKICIDHWCYITFLIGWWLLWFLWTMNVFSFPCYTLTSYILFIVLDETNFLNLKSYMLIIKISLNVVLRNSYLSVIRKRYFHFLDWRPTALVSLDDEYMSLCSLVIHWLVTYCLLY